jgi:predicted DNA-binding transcriptional regulator AlpA
VVTVLKYKYQYFIFDNNTDICIIVTVSGNSFLFDYYLLIINLLSESLLLQVICFFFNIKIVMDDNKIERYVDIKRVSKYTSLSIKTLYEWSSVGNFPSIKIGRRVLYDLHDIDELMAKLKRPSLTLENTVNKIIGDLHANVI